MSDKIEYSRLILKRTDGSGVTPTIPTGTTLDTFTATDTFEGELFLNIADDKMWVRTQNGQIPILLSGNTGFTESLSQTLANGNTTGGNYIVMSQDDRITSFSGNSYIEFNKITDELIKLYSNNIIIGSSDVGVSPLDLTLSHSDTGTTIGQVLIDNNSLDITFNDGVDRDTQINLSNEYLTLSSTNTDDGYELQLQLDGQNAQMFEIVGNTGLSTFSRTTRQIGSITDYCGNSGVTDYSSVSQGDSSIYSLIVSGSNEVTKWRMTETQISGSTTDGGTIYTSFNYTPGAFDFLSTDATNTTSINTSANGGATIDIASSNGTSSASVSVYDTGIQFNMTDISTFSNNFSLNSSISSPYGMTISSSNPSSSDVGSVNIDAAVVNINITDGVDISNIDVTTTDITIDTLALLIPNLPTSSSGLTSNQLFTQTATELGGTGSTKVICIV